MSENTPAAPSARRRATHDRLLEAAIAVFAEAGIQGASVEAICSRAGFTRGAFYSNFESKEQLFLALLERQFSQHAQELAQKADELEPELRACGDVFTPDQAAKYVIEFLTPSQDHETWFALEMELLLLALRDPSSMPAHHGFKEGFYGVIAEPVERIVAAAGRRFVIPVQRALPVLGSVYEDALRTAVLSGPETGAQLDELGDRIAELLFALTEETGRRLDS